MIYSKSKTVGIILDHLSISQLNVDCLKELNNVAKNTTNNVCVFYKNISPPATKVNFGVFGLNLINDVEEGLLIATDLDSANILINSSTKARKAFYIWDLEWLHNPTKNDFLKNVDIYRNIELYTRSLSYSLSINNYCNISPKVKTIEELINEI